MKRFWFYKGMGFLAFMIIGFLLIGLVVMLLWNWLMPELFGLPQITHVQALGLFALSRILFGGPFSKGRHRHKGKGKRYWRGRMKEKWQKMTPEEREKFKTGMRCAPWVDKETIEKKDEPTDLV